MASPALLARAASLLLTDEDTRKKIGWVIVTILAPIILLVAFFCALGSAAADHNTSAVELCFNGGEIPAEFPEEYRLCLEAMRDSLSALDSAVTEINGQIEDGTGLDALKVKALFYALYFGADSQPDVRQFANCFVTYEERTRTVITEDENGDPVETEEPCTVAVPIQNMEQVYQNILSVLGAEVTTEHQNSADDICALIQYGYTGGNGDFAGADVPFVGADGFCSPVGGNWRSVVTSEFGNRKDPITGKRKGHTGMDLAVPTGTPIRAALPGTVTVSKYDAGGYGYYVKIDHGGGLETLYGHNSKLIARVGQTVQAGDVVALSGSTGRSTGPHLHFEVRVNGERTDPRRYLP